MNVRKKRIKQWIIWIIIALLCLGVQNTFLKEKEPFMVCAPEDMRRAFKLALKQTDLKNDYKVVITDDPTNANFYVDYGKKNDSSYEKFAFSTFVVGYSSNKDCLAKLEDGNVIKESIYSDETYEINLYDIINAVIKNKKLDDYKIEGFGKVKVVYPAKDTIYWEDFYDLMLITVNDGKYPDTKEEYTNAVNILESFFESENTEATSNFRDKVVRSGGFSPDIFYIGPEKAFLPIGYGVRFFYPTETVYFNYYFKTDELGRKVVEAFDKENGNGIGFYDKLYGVNYRTKIYSGVYGGIEGIYSFGNVCNIVPIPEKTEFYMETKE